MKNLKTTQFKHCFLAVVFGLLLTTTAFAQNDSAAVPSLKITMQPDSISIAQKDNSVTLSIAAQDGENAISFQWYRSYKDSLVEDEAIEGATDSAYTTDVFSEKEIRYYYCIVTSDENSVKSRIATVAYTGLPLLYVNTPNKVEITSKKDWTKGATLTLTNAGKDEWNFENVSTSIRGRGNSTWAKAKKPYALKLDEKQKILGMPKHKRWVLIANYTDNSFLKNHMAFYMSEKFGMDYTVHGQFVDLYFNGVYRGLYWLGEAIKVDKNRVNIDDGRDDMTDEEDKDYLVEMDAYFDEPVKFRSSIRRMPYMIKNDDYMIDKNDSLTSGGKARLARFKAKINKLENLLYPNYVSGLNLDSAAAPDESYTKIIDVDTWAKFWLINEIMDNIEFRHPKSCYFTYHQDSGILKAGPVWDHDWSFLVDSVNSTRLRGYVYYNALFKSPLFIAAVKRIWETYSELFDFDAEIEMMRDSLIVAADVDKIRWGVHPDPDSAKQWKNFSGYVDYLKVMINKKFGVVGKFVTDSLPQLKVVSPTIALSSDEFEYSGLEAKPIVTVTDGADTLKEGTDYEIAFFDNISVGTARLQFSAKGDYAGYQEKTFSIVPKTVVVTVENASKNYGKKDPILDYNVEGLLTINGVKEKLKKIHFAREEGEDAGDYAITFSVDSAANPNYAVTVNNGVFTIYPDTTEIVVTVKGHTDTVEYNGKKRSVYGFDIESSSEIYSLDFVSYKGDSLASGTDVNSYSMGLVAKDFVNTSVNYPNVTFDITDGNLVVTQKPVVLTVTDLSKTYGKKDPELKYTVDGLVTVDGTKDKLKNVTLKRKYGEDVGEYAVKATIDYDANPNYSVNIKKGLFTINPDTTEVVVTVKGHTDTVVYNGEKQSVHGFDMTFSNEAYSADFVSYDGDSLASGTKVKTYSMGLAAKNFSNSSENFTNVVFEIEDGSLTIKKEEKKDALPAAASERFLRVFAMNRRIQVNNSMVGERYAVYDMQGNVVMAGMVEAPSFEIPVAKSGVYMVRVGSLAQRINVR